MGKLTAIWSNGRKDTQLLDYSAEDPVCSAYYKLANSLSDIISFECDDPDTLMNKAKFYDHASRTYRGRSIHIMSAIQEVT